ncbi:MAG: amidohydrolase family protein [Candidatus Polarisedimenticolia bacterium]
MRHAIPLLIQLILSTAAPPSIAIRNVTVLPMDGEHVLAGHTVVVKDGTVTRMGPTSEVPIPSDAVTIDGTGRFLMPGLVDAHVHLASNTEEQQRALLTMFVVNGVTTVVNLRGTPQILALRAAVAGGTVFGPTLYTAGPYVNEPFVTTPDEVERAVVEQRRDGYDFVKLHGDLSRDAYARLNAVARREGLRVIGHAPRNLGLDVMFEERQYALAHAEEFLYDQENTSKNFHLIEPRIPELTRSMVAGGIWLMPNLTAFKTIGAMVRDLNGILARQEMRYLPAAVQDGWGPATNPYTNRLGPEQVQKIQVRYQLLEKLVRAFQAGGVRLLIGTDAMNTGVVPGFSVHDELADLVAAGLTPFEALRAATANGAEFLGVGRKQGLVAAGQAADLVLLDADPLMDVAHSRRIAGVMLRGRWIPRSEIDSTLERLAQEAAAAPRLP